MSLFGCLAKDIYDGQTDHVWGGITTRIAAQSCQVIDRGAIDVMIEKAEAVAEKKKVLALAKEAQRRASKEDKDAKKARQEQEKLNAKAAKDAEKDAARLAKLDAKRQKAEGIAADRMSLVSGISGSACGSAADMSDVASHIDDMSDDDDALGGFLVGFGGAKEPSKPQKRNSAAGSGIKRVTLGTYPLDSQFCYQLDDWDT